MTEISQEAVEPVKIAQLFHENYERLAPEFGYRTREASAKPWDDVPPKNQMLMVATVRAVLPAIQAQVLDHLDGIEWPTCPNEHDHAAAWIEGRDAAVRAFIRRLATLNPNEEEDCNCESCSFSRLGPKGKG